MKRYDTFEAFRECGDMDARIVNRYIEQGNAELAAMAAFYAARHNLIQESIEKNMEALKRMTAPSTIEPVIA